VVNINYVILKQDRLKFGRHILTLQT